VENRLTSVRHTWTVRTERQLTRLIEFLTASNDFENLVVPAGKIERIRRRHEACFTPELGALKTHQFIRWQLSDSRCSLRQFITFKED